MTKKKPDPYVILQEALDWVMLEFFKPADERQFTTEDDYLDAAYSRRLRGTDIPMYSIAGWIIARYYGTESPYNGRYSGGLYDHFEDLLGLTYEEADELYDAATPARVRQVIQGIFSRLEAEQHARYTNA